MNDPTSPSPLPASSISIGGIIMVVIGGLLLVFPGGCGLIGLASVVADYAGGHRGGGGGLDLTGLVVVLSLMGLAVAVLGFLLIRWGLRRRRVIQSPGG